MVNRKNYGIKITGLCPEKKQLLIAISKAHGTTTSSFMKKQLKLINQKYEHIKEHPVH